MVNNMEINNFSKSVVSFFIVLSLFSSLVLANADITYNFNTDDVRMVIYDCLDAGCSQVSSSPWYDESTSSGSLLVSFPTTLRSAYGYAQYFFSPGYIPKVSNPTWHGTGATSVPVSFDKVDDCHAIVDNFYVLNEVYENEPVVINFDTSIGADISSAFSEAQNIVSYVPPAFIDDYYSADTIH